jgi:hypothetical protein
MGGQAIRCGECSWPIPAEAWNREEGVTCPGCRQKVQVAAFPAIGGARIGALPEAVLADTEASCFFHPESRAAVPCDECGRFLCRLCDIEVDSRHLCPSCFQAGVAGNKLENVETRRTMYDTMALAFATLPALLIWPAIVGAPAALYIVFRRWNAPRSIVPRTRIRFYLAVLFALGEIVGVVLLIWAVVRLPRLTSTP